MTNTDLYFPIQPDKTISWVMKLFCVDLLEGWVMSQVRAQVRSTLYSLFYVTFSVHTIAFLGLLYYSHPHWNHQLPVFCVEGDVLNMWWQVATELFWHAHIGLLVRDRAWPTCPFLKASFSKVIDDSVLEIFSSFTHSQGMLYTRRP